MIFRATKLKTPITSSTMASILYQARRKVYLYFTSTNEIALNEYIKKTYKTTLKNICVRLLSFCKFTPDNQTQEVLITFKTKWADDLASLITYGNSQLQGSNILRFALNS